uniref:Putative pectate lyase n=1 Tax=viral metagenome TaxID=1070528 RepID=A0A6M3KXH3_9ZZZZ
MADVPWVDVRTYGAKGDGETDDTKAIQAVIDVVKAMDNGGVVFFPPGTFQVTSLNLSGTTGNRLVSPSIALIGSGIKATRLEGTLNGAILIDAMGRDFLSVEDMEIGTDGTAVYQTGIFLARRTGGLIECLLNRFKNLYIRGDFSVAAMVAIAAETNYWEQCVFENNDDTNGYCCFFTGPNNDVAGITSTNGTPLASTNTCNTMVKCTFISENNNATLLIFDESAEYDMISCNVEGGNHTGIKFATYIGGQSGVVFKGPVNWVGTLWEASSGTVHYLTTPGAGGYYTDIIDAGGIYRLYGSGVTSYAMAHDANPATTIKCSIKDVRIEVPGSLDISLTYSLGCHFDIWSPSYPTTITIASGKNASFFRALTLSLPVSDMGAWPGIVDTHAETVSGDDGYGTTLPATGTWKRGMRFWRSDATASASPGWICVTSGTYSAATDATGDTDGSTAVITGMEDTSDFYIGNYVTVSAGFPTTGPYRIISKAATTVTVETNSDSAQSNITVSTPDPVWKTMASLGA